MKIDDVVPLTFYFLFQLHESSSRFFLFSELISQQDLLFLETNTHPIIFYSVENKYCVNN